MRASACRLALARQRDHERLRHSLAEQRLRLEIGQHPVARDRADPRDSMRASICRWFQKLHAAEPTTVRLPASVRTCTKRLLRSTRGMPST